MLKSLSLLFVLLGPVAAYGDPIDSTLILFAQFGDARMTSAATLVDVEERWAIGAYHFTRASRNPVALLPIRDTEDRLVTEPERYWQRLNRPRDSARESVLPGEVDSFVDRPPDEPGDVFRTVEGGARLGLAHEMELDRAANRLAHPPTGGRRAVPVRFQRRPRPERE
jgi:hypothetical protein